ncbi:MAG: hypothetical protein IJJ26_01000, partial [Victivallales bacterium]|nr:hypothetical protein [Victivallales bacterium]
GTLGERGALPTARAIAGRSSAPVLRASAIAAVGMLGDASDLPLLKRLAASGGRARLQSSDGGPVQAGGRKYLHRRCEWLENHCRRGSREINAPSWLAKRGSRGNVMGKD